MNNDEVVRTSDIYFDSPRREATETSSLARLNSGLIGQAVSKDKSKQSSTKAVLSGQQSATPGPHHEVAVVKEEVPSTAHSSVKHNKDPYHSVQRERSLRRKIKSPLDLGKGRCDSKRSSSAGVLSFGRQSRSLTSADDALVKKKSGQTTLIRNDMNSSIEIEDGRLNPSEENTPTEATQLAQTKTDFRTAPIQVENTEATFYTAPTQFANTETTYHTALEEEKTQNQCERGPNQGEFDNNGLGFYTQGWLGIVFFLFDLVLSFFFIAEWISPIEYIDMRQRRP